MIEVTPLDFMGSDLTVVNAARVSFGKRSEWEWDYKEFRTKDGNWVSTPTKNHLSQGDTKLIHYLAKHGHYSPFGHCFASFHVKAPIFVARQLVKHKFLRWNEISRRYVDDEPEFYVPEVWRGRTKDKKQGSGESHPLFNRGVGTGYVDTYCDTVEEAVNQYKWMIEIGVAPEQARMVLPQSTMTEWYWSGSLDAFASMCNLRLKEDTQYESRIVAEGVSKAMSKEFPVSWAALVGIEYDGA